jgi:hypothetical protein
LELKLLIQANNHANLFQLSKATNELDERLIAFKSLASR